MPVITRKGLSLGVTFLARRLSGVCGCCSRVQALARGSTKPVVTLSAPQKRTIRLDFPSVAALLDRGDVPVGSVGVVSAGVQGRVASWRETCP